MSITQLQKKIRACKTPVGLLLSPAEERLDGRFLKNFADMYGECPMAHAEALRFHGSQAISQTAGKLPAVLLKADCYLRWGFMGLDVLTNLVNMAKNQGMYTIVDARGAAPDVWIGGSVNADAATILPYGGTSCCEVPEDKAVIAVLRTREAGLSSVQNLMAGDRRLYIAAGEQMARAGAACMVETGFQSDIKELRGRLKDAFLLLSNCTDDDAYPAFDEFGRGALVLNEEIQYAPDMAAAAEEAAAKMKKTIQVL